MNHRQTQELPNEKESFFKRHKVLTIIAVLLVGYLLYCVIYVANEDKPAATLAPAKEEITAAALYNQVNTERQKAGVQALSFNDKLNQSAKMKCDDMVSSKYYEHENPITHKRGGQYVFDVLPNASLASENLDQGLMPNTAQVIQDWLNSPNHKAAMLDPKWTDMGFAVCKLPDQPEGTNTVVQHLAIIKDQPAQAQTTQPQPQQRTAQSCITTYTKAYPGMSAQAITSCH